MDAQFKKGTLDVVVLASLIKEDSYGYQIIKDIQNITEIKESTLYPILRRLENSGCLTTYSKIHNSRVRKFYHITDNGYNKLLEYMEDFKELMKIYQFINQEVFYNEQLHR